MVLLSLYLQYTWVACGVLQVTEADLSAFASSTALALVSASGGVRQDFRSRTCDMRPWCIISQFCL